MSPRRPAGRQPEPARFWVRWRPRGWPVAEGPWTDLAEARLGAAPGRRAGDELGKERPLPPVAGPLDDLLYLPPVPAEAEPARREAAQAWLAAGTPVLYQVLPAGDEEPPPAGATVVVDLLPLLLAGDGELAAVVPPAAPGAAAVWPQVPGLGDRPEIWRRGCERLAAAGYATVQPLALGLDPADRRRLAERAPEGAYHDLFHRPPPAERAFSRVAAGFGLAPFVRRPGVEGPPAGAGNRRLAGLLALAAELWLRVGRSEAQGQALFRAARWADETGYDLAALAREGNLGVVAALDPTSRELIGAALGAAAGGDEAADPPLLAKLLAEYLEGGSEGGEDGEEAG